MKRWLVRYLLLCILLASSLGAKNKEYWEAWFKKPYQCKGNIQFCMDYFNRAGYLHTANYYANTKTSSGGYVRNGTTYKLSIYHYLSKLQRIFNTGASMSNRDFINTFGPEDSTQIGLNHLIWEIIIDYQQTSIHCFDYQCEKLAFGRWFPDYSVRYLSHLMTLERSSSFSNISMIEMAFVMPHNMIDTTISFIPINS